MEKVATKSKAQRKRLPGLLVADGFLRHPFDEANGTRTSGLVATSDGRKPTSANRSTALANRLPSKYADKADDAAHDAEKANEAK